MRHSDFTKRCRRQDLRGLDGMRWGGGPTHVLAGAGGAEQDYLRKVVVHASQFLRRSAGIPWSWSILSLSVPVAIAPTLRTLRPRRCGEGAPWLDSRGRSSPQEVGVVKCSERSCWVLSVKP